VQSTERRAEEAIPGEQAEQKRRSGRLVAGGWWLVDRRLPSRHCGSKRRIVDCASAQSAKGCQSKEEDNVKEAALGRGKPSPTIRIPSRERLYHPE